MKVNFTDGEEIEIELLERLKNTDDLSLDSTELTQNLNKWALEYHLTPLRHNLLRGLNLEQVENALELGAGCGAITRQLGERCQNVVAVEGNFNRARIARERCRDLNNVTILSDNFINYPKGQHYDLITLIGVLEYAPIFIKHPDPIGQLLRLVKDLLTPDGTLVIAIENQLGLKYFNGCNEDHLGLAFYGINDLYHQGTQVTFGYKELKHRLSYIGFKQQEFMFPFPDYKIPQLVVRQQAFEENDLRPGNIISNFPARDYAGQHYRLFSETLAWPLMDRNDLIMHLSNSFLVLASVQNSKLTKEQNWVIKLFNNHRKDQFCTESTFCENKTSGFRVEKKRLKKLPVTVKESEVLNHRLGKAPYIKGRPMGLTIAKYLLANDIHPILTEELKQWGQLLLQNRLPIDTESLPFTWLKSLPENSQSLLPGHFIDCTPRNLIHDGQTWHYIDQEWEWREPLPLIWVVFRGLNSMLNDNKLQVRMCADFYQISPAEWILKRMQEMGFKLGLQSEAIQIFHELIGLESRFLHEVSGREEAEIKHQITSQVFTKFKKIESVEQNKLNTIGEAQIKNYQRRINDLEQRLLNSQQLIESMQTSLVWRAKEELITRFPFLRQIKKLVVKK